MKKKAKTTAESVEETNTPLEAAPEEMAEVVSEETPEPVIPEPVEDLHAVVESLKNELQETQAKADEYLDGWQRSRAEFANYKKRLEREQTQMNQVATGNIIKRFLDIVDDLDRALKKCPQEGDGANWAGGIELIYRKFLNVLEAEGVYPIEAEGETFDPNLHEAISQEDHPELESGRVIGVVQQGYVQGDRVLRPARVRVAR